ncbi:MAG: HDIG domain-containing protein [Methanoregulaceae archaeon]|nr:HDIG domain-containing protein [Methanoregulaceae archaeon]
MREDRNYEEILRQAGCDSRVIAHCRAVRDLSCAYAKAGRADLRLVEAGAYLHDVGRGVTHSVHHAQEGAAWCRRKDFPPEVCRIVERHIGAGITADECSLLGLFPRDCVPATLEEKIVANADNLTAGTSTVSIEDHLGHVFWLPVRTRRRIYRLWLEMEQVRRSAVRS